MELFKKLSAYAVMLAALTLGTGFVVGCEESDDMGDDIGDAMDDAADNTEDAMEDTGDAIKDGAEDAGDSMEDATN